LEPLFLAYLNSEKPVFKKTLAFPSRRKRRVRALAVLVSVERGIEGGAPE
jgi:hypothetical protein